MARQPPPQEAAGCLDSALADLKTHAGQLATAEADKLRLGNELRDLQARHKVWGQDMSALGPLATTSKRVLLVSRLLSNSVLPLLAQPDSPDSGASACRPGPRKRATGGCAGTEVCARCTSAMDRDVQSCTGSLAHFLGVR